MCINRGRFISSTSLDYGLTSSRDYMWTGDTYLVGESSRTAVQHILQDPERYWQLHRRDQPRLQAFHYLQKQITAKVNDTRTLKVAMLSHHNIIFKVLLIHKITRAAVLKKRQTCMINICLECQANLLDLHKRIPCESETIL